MHNLASRRRGARRILPPLVAGVTLTALLAACTGPGDSGSDDGPLRIVLAAEPPTLEACDATLSPVGVVIRSNITEPLVEMNSNTGELEPLLATSWERISETEWQFSLVEGATFHDGTAFDAEAAAASIERQINGGLECSVTGNAFDNQPVTTQVVDSSTLVVGTEGPDPLLPLKLSFVEITNDDPAAKVRIPNGTGPYRVDAWNAGTSIELSLYEDYWGEAPAFAEVEYQWRDEGSVRAAMVTQGEADLAFGLAEGDGAGELGKSFINNETVMLRMDATMPPFDDIRIRQAVNYAIDRQAIAQGLYDGLVTPAGQLVPPGAVGYNEDLGPWEYDLDQAVALVQEAAADGVAVDTPIKLVARIENFPYVEEVGQVIQEAMNQIGLDVTLEMMDAARQSRYEAAPFVRDEETIALIMPHGNNAGDASFTVVNYLTSTGVVSFFGDPVVDEMIAAAALLEGEERDAAYEEVLEYYTENVTGLAVLFHLRGLMAVSDSISYEPDNQATDEVRLREIAPAA